MTSLTHFCNRIIAFNSRPSGSGKLWGFAANQRPFDDGEWQQITPYGDFPNRIGLQRVTRESAQRMVDAFNALPGRNGARFQGLPIYIGHPDLEPDKYPDKRRIGRILELDAREDGLWGRNSWSAAGQENHREGYHPYPSPAWSLERNADGSVTPVELISVGMTPFPNIDGVPSWSANEHQPAPGDGAQPTKKDMPEWLIEMLGLKKEATEDEIKTALKSKLDALADATQKATDAEAKATEAVNARTSAETAKAAAETAAANERSERAKLMLDVAINEGRVLPADRGTWEVAFNSNFDDASARLAKETKKLPSKTIDLSGSRKSIATYNERQALVNAAVNERIKGGLSYTEAFAAVKADPEFAGVFEAMTSPKS